MEIAKRYEIEFLEIGSDRNHVHFLVQSVPTYSPTKIVRTIKSLTARQIRGLHPEVRELLWGGPFWSSGYFMATVGRHASEDVIQRYVKHQGDQQSYRRIHEQQLGLFDQDDI
jgi:REP element-mobilizing transposase RayT